MANKKSYSIEEIEEIKAEAKRQVIEDITGDCKTEFKLDCKTEFKLVLLCPEQRRQFMELANVWGLMWECKLVEETSK
jgi:hypothetical protein